MRSAGLRLLSSFTLIALLMTSAIPQGWMPLLGQNGHVLLVLCTDTGIEERWVKIEDDTPSPDGDSTGTPCVFSSAALLAITPPDMLLRAMGDIHSESWRIARLARRVSEDAYRHPARAPPRTA